MLCPFCLAEVPFKQDSKSNQVHYSCPECREMMPAAYVTEYKQCPPVVVNAIGFRGHGKTVYFASLFYVLSQEVLGRYWDGFYTMCLNEQSQETVINNVQMLKRGELPQSTPKNFPAPTVVRFCGIPSYPNRTLLFYDTSGEAFEKASQLGRYAGFVKRAQTAVFLIDLTQLDHIPRDMHQLANTYVIGMHELGGDTGLQNLLVVYTKGDRLQDRLSNYPELVNYLTLGTVEGLANVEGYYGRMRRVSGQLEHFTRYALGSRQFLALAKDRFRSVNFCIISALGAPPQGNQLSASVTPKRVLDPLLWLIEGSLSFWERWFR